MASLRNFFSAGAGGNDGNAQSNPGRTTPTQDRPSEAKVDPSTAAAATAGNDGLAKAAAGLHIDIPAGPGGSGDPMAHAQTTPSKEGLPSKKKMIRA